ncbi:hypothetical protein [Roseivirga sp. 4D4]|uniref:hypothetical protein n=1 Tax=Roseivirga sp. 4D4 TaxID=1889784 RepID=UPI001112E9B3|nr:hypothetical protein [Roseivirga sp. 4D4]
MIKSLLTTTLMLIALNLKAQEYYQPEVDSQLVVPKFAVKVVPTQLAWRFPSVTAAIEHRLGNNFNIEYRYGSILPWDVFEDDVTYFADKSGFKSSVTLKVYASEPQTLSGLRGWLNRNPRTGILPFIGLELLFNEINYDRTRVFRLDCGSGCEYFEKATYGITRQDIGVRWNIGFLTHLIGPIDLEILGAIGFINQDFTPDARRPENFDRMYGRDYDDEFQGIVPSLNFSFKLMYSIK